MRNLSDLIQLSKIIENNIGLLRSDLEGLQRSFIDVTGQEVRPNGHPEIDPEPTPPLPLTEEMILNEVLPKPLKERFKHFQKAKDNAT